MGNQNQRRKRIDSWFEVQQKAVSPIKKGILLKQSKYLKQWRRQKQNYIRRSVVLKSGHIFTFKTNVQERQPTAAQNFVNIHSFIKDEEKEYFLLKIITKGKIEYNFKTKSQSERDEWYNKIKSQKQRRLKQSSTYCSKVQEPEEQHAQNDTLF